MTNSPSSFAPFWNPYTSDYKHYKSVWDSAFRARGKKIEITMRNGTRRYGVLSDIHTTPSGAIGVLVNYGVFHEKYHPNDFSKIYVIDECRID